MSTWTHQLHGRRIKDDQGRLVAEVYSGGIGIQGADQAGHLIAAAPELLALAEKFLTETIAERDCFYDGCSDDQGVVPLEEDQQALDYYDALINRIRATIAKAKGENDWVYRSQPAEPSIIDQL